MRERSHFHSAAVASVMALTLVLAAGADARSLMKRAADEIRKTRDAESKGGSDESQAEETDAPPATSGGDTAADPPRAALDRTQAWADACEADARVRVKEHRPVAEAVTFHADDAKEWQEGTGVRGVEGKGEFSGWGGSRSAFSYRCRYDVGQRKVTWGRVTIGR